jgi:hypothetical protein
MKVFVLLLYLSPLRLTTRRYLIGAAVVALRHTICTLSVLVAPYPVIVATICDVKVTIHVVYS